MIGDSRDGWGRRHIFLVSTGFSKQGFGRLLGPPISARGVVPPGFLWVQQGGGGQPQQLHHKGARGSSTRSAELGFRRSVSERHATAVSNQPIRELLDLCSKFQES